MNILVIASQALLYVCFALLMGSFVLQLVPATYRPTIMVRKRLLYICTIAIPILAFFPVLNIILYIAPRLGFFESVKIVLSTYMIGTAWDFTFLVSLILIMMIAIANKKNALYDKPFLIIGAFLTTLSMLTVAWASHAHALSPLIGLMSDFLHLLAVSIWVGILLVVGLYAKDYSNWLSFLKWFTIVAVCCLSVTAISGLFLMEVLVDDYVAGWVISYGAGLLLKHLFILPLVFYAIFNSFFVKYKVSKDPNFNPLKGVRVESLLLLTIFIITAVFSQQPPAHMYELSENVLSPLFRLFNDSPVNAESAVGFVVKLPSVLWFFITVFFTLLAIILAFFKKTPIVVLFILCFCAIASVFSTVMATIVIR